jgi:CubicO group peptidase (beta-lactamase class C family)
MAVAIVRGGKVVEKAAAGVRRFDRPDRVQTGDSFHLGSVGKSFTATMIGKLVEEGVLRWDVTISEALHEVPMRAEYRGVTLEQLLQHRGGVPSMSTTGEFAKTTDLWARRSSAEARAALVRQVLTEEPVKLGEYSYSNSGYVVAGFMAERVARQSWEELMRSLVLGPLGLQSGGFGWPATGDRPNQPHGHLGTPPELSVQEPGEHPLLGDMDYVGPAGNLHCSMPDLGRFAAFHLQGLHGRDGLLKAETVRRLHTPPGDGFYASGWEIRESDEGERFHEHTGTGLTFYVWIVLYPERDLAIVLAANCGLPAKPFLRKMKAAIHRRMAQND